VTTAPAHNDEDEHQQNRDADTFGGQVHI